VTGPKGGAIVRAHDAGACQGSPRGLRILRSAGFTNRDVSKLRAHQIVGKFMGNEFNHSDTALDVGGIRADPSPPGGPLPPGVELVYLGRAAPYQPTQPLWAYKAADGHMYRHWSDIPGFETWKPPDRNRPPV